MKLRITRPLFQGAQMLAPGVIVDVPASVADVYLRQKAAIVLEDPAPHRPAIEPQAMPVLTKSAARRKKHAQPEADS